MREIKFRGQKEDGIWKYGFCQFAPKASGAPGCVAYIVNLDENGCFQTHSVIPKPIGQFTGLKDENGQEIYKGDIVLGDENNYEVIWENERARFNIKKWYNGSQDCATCAFSEQFCHEVIGTIHENPELLNG